MTRVLFSLILLTVLSACNKSSDPQATKEPHLERCEWLDYYAPASFGFIGFSADEVDTIYVSNYKANTSFSQLLRIDTLINGPFIIQQDTTFIADTAFHKPKYFIQEGIDYDIKIPGANERFLVTKAGHIWRDPVYYTVDCLPRNRSFPMDSLFIDGQLIRRGNLDQASWPDACFFVHK